ncbi:MAG: trigger factor [Simkaniaceae bacterium]|nr:trigger factor [Simkaniaceae bacterium]
MTAQHQTEHLDLEIEHKEHCITHFLVKVKPDFVKTAHRAAIKSLSKDVSVPGFRKGKAPESLIIKKYPSQLTEKWHKELADAAFKEAEQLVKIPVLAETRVGFEAEKVSLEEGAILKFSFETEPVIPEIDLAKLSLPEIEEEKVEDKQVDERIEDMREYFGTWASVKDRPVQADDYATVTVDIIDVEPPVEAISNVRFKVAPERMAKWMRDTVIGMHVDESKEAISTPDEDATEEVKAESPPKKVKLTLTNLQTLEKAPLDETLTKKMGADTVEEFRKRLTEMLVKQAQEKYQSNLREKISESLITTHPFDLPQSLIRKETEFRIRQLLEDPSFQESLRNMTPEEQKQEVANLQTYSARAIRLFYLCRAVIDKNNLEVAENDLKSLDVLFDASQQSRSNEQKATALSRLMLRTAQDFLIEKTLAKK